MARPAKWNSPTESVRLPAHAVDQCLALARALDQPPPEATSDQEFEEYCRFVQNLTSPKLVSIRDQDEVEPRHYLMLSDPCTFEEYRYICQIVDDLKSCQDWQGLSKDERLYVLSRMIEQTFEPVKRSNG